VWDSKPFGKGVYRWAVPADFFMGGDGGDGFLLKINEKINLKSEPDLDSARSLLVENTNNTKNRSKSSKALIYTSWRTDSNPRPADYKSAALPTELRQRAFCNHSTQV
jgi:hypothetical protein